MSKFKIIGALTTLLGFGLTMIANWAGDRELDRIIDEKLDDRLEEKEKEEEETEEEG
ncbi:MAG: hypothetical protein J6X92_04475 [Bacteroidales bacterium]|nr:hypothetical protein [Bacteroidales bacterium]